MKDKFSMNLFIALPAAVVTVILYAVIGGQGSGALRQAPITPCRSCPARLFWSPR